MKHWYESCTGSVYATSEPIEIEICERCGDTDTYIGEFETEKEAVEALNDYSEYY